MPPHIPGRSFRAFSPHRSPARLISHSAKCARDDAGRRRRCVAAITAAPTTNPPASVSARGGLPAAFRRWSRRRRRAEKTGRHRRPGRPQGARQVGLSALDPSPIWSAGWRRQPRGCSSRDARPAGRRHRPGGTPGDGMRPASTAARRVQRADGAARRCGQSATAASRAASEHAGERTGGIRPLVVLQREDRAPWRRRSYAVPAQTGKPAARSGAVTGPLMRAAQRRTPRHPAAPQPTQPTGKKRASASLAARGQGGRRSPSDQTFRRTLQLVPSGDGPWRRRRMPLAGLGSAADAVEGAPRSGCCELPREVLERGPGLRLLLPGQVDAAAPGGTPWCGPPRRRLRSTRTWWTTRGCVCRRGTSTVRRRACGRIRRARIRV